MSGEDGGDAWLIGMILHMHTTGQWSPEAESALRAKRRTELLEVHKRELDRERKLRAQVAAEENAIRSGESVLQPVPGSLTKQLIRDAEKSVRARPDRFSWTEVAGELNVSESTLLRARDVLGMLTRRRRRLP